MKISGKEPGGTFPIRDADGTTFNVRVPMAQITNYKQQIILKAPNLKIQNLIAFRPPERFSRAGTGILSGRGLPFATCITRYVHPLNSYKYIWMVFSSPK